MKATTKLLLAAGVLTAVKGLDNRLEVTHFEPEFENLAKEFDGFKIAQISDLHSESTPGVCEEIKAHNPDIIVITGDMIHDDDRPYKPVISLIRRLSLIAPLYVISGNHDLWNTNFNKFIKEAEDNGAIYIDNKKAIIEKDGSFIELFGVRDPYSKSADMIIKSLDESFSSLPEKEHFSILLFHRANQFDRIKDKGFDLILSGHMHGGQFRIPGVLGVASPKSGIGDTQRLLFPKYYAGTFHHENTTMIVNRGLGNPMIIPRLFNRPEIGIIELKKKPRA